MSNFNQDLFSSAWPVGKLVDIQVRITGSDGGFNLIGALNDNSECKDNFFKSISINRVSAKTYMSGNFCVEDAFSHAVDILNRYKNGDYGSLEQLEQFLIYHSTNKVDKENYGGDPT